MSFARRSAATPRLRQRRLQRLGLLAAADERDVVGIDGERRLQRGLVAAALRRDDDVARAGLRHRQRIAFDAAIGLAEGAPARPPARTP